MHSPRHLIGMAVCVALAVGPLRAADPYLPAPYPSPYPAPAAYPAPYPPYAAPAAQPLPPPQSPYDSPQARYLRGLYVLQQRQAQELQGVRQAQYEQQQEEIRYARFRAQQLGLPAPQCPTPTPPPAPGAPTPAPKTPQTPSPKTPETPQTPDTTQQPTDTTPTPDTGAPDTGTAGAEASSAFSQAPPSGTSEAASFAPQMIGSSQNQTIIRPVVVTTVLTTAAGTPLGTVTEQIRYRQPVISRGAFQIADNESPRPQDRLYLSYNYFNSLRFETFPATSALSLTPASVNFNRFGPGPVPLPFGFTDTEFTKYTLHRYTVGFEKTFLNDNASVGIRVPILQPVQSISSTALPQRVAVFANPGVPTFGTVAAIDNNIDHTDIGDLTLIFKYALCHDCRTGTVISTGLAVTIPTGPNIRDANDNEIHPWLFQPYVGYLFPLGCDAYAHGFVSVVAPSDSRDNVRVFTDVGVGYYLYRAWCGGLITYVTPTLELHVDDPVTHRKNLGPIFEPDTFSLTGGVHFGLCGGKIFTVGANVPLSGPRPYDFEVIGQLNCSF
jgi:hypothetical protein